ncbi:hypothetical protein AMTRI_Chr12g242220 [Amborella trichopoda]
MKRPVCYAKSGGLAVQPLRACFQLCRRKLGCLLYRELPTPPAPPISKRSIIEGFDAFISERACFCAHVLLHLPRFSFETEGTKQALAIVFLALRKPFLLVIASRYICCPGYIKKVLEKDEDEGLTEIMYLCLGLNTCPFFRYI